MIRMVGWKGLRSDVGGHGGWTVEGLLKKMNVECLVGKDEETDL